MSMRGKRVVRAGALVAVLLALGTPGRAAAPMAAVLAMEGWRRTETPSGVAAYACVSPGCPVGARASYRMQPHRPDLAREAFEAHHMRLARDAPAGSRGQILTAGVHDLEERTVEAMRILSIWRDVAWSDGTRAASIDALLIGPPASRSVVADAADPRTVAAVFDHFLPRLIDLVLVTEPAR